MTQKKISNYIRFFVLLLPIFIILLSTFRNGTIGALTDFVDSYLDTLPPIFFDIKEFFKAELGFDSTMFEYAYYYLTYVFCMDLTLLIFDFILFIPRWIRGLIFSYEKKNKF